HREGGDPVSLVESTTTLDVKLSAMSIATALISVGFILGIAWIAGCAWYRTGPQWKPGAETSGYILEVVEFDDQGWLFDRQQLAEVLSNVRKAAEPGNATIVVYVHGWHHSADPEDSDLKQFVSKILSKLVEKESMSFSEVEPARGGTSPVIGVYVGWR